MGIVQDAEEILGRDLAPGSLAALTGDLNERLRVREMEAVYRSSALAVVPLPSFFLHAVTVRVDGCELAAASLSTLGPGRFAVFGPELRLGTTGTEMEMLYLARIPPIEGERFSEVGTAYPSLMLYGLLAHHSALIRDEGQAHYSPLFEQALAKANENYARSRQSETLARPIGRYRP